MAGGDDLGTLVRTILSKVISNKLGSQISYAGKGGLKLRFSETNFKAVLFSK